MIALDTRILIRVVVNDEPARARRALEILHSGPTWVSKTVLLEIEWVPCFSYELDVAAVAEVFERLLDVRGVTVEDPAAVELALHWYRQGLDFADALPVASSFASFDRRLARRAGTHPPVALAARTR